MTSMELIQKLEIETEGNPKKSVERDWRDKKLTLIALYRLVGKPDLAEKEIESSMKFFKKSKNQEWVAHLEWFCNQEKNEDFCKKN